MSGKVIFRIRYGAKNQSAARTHRPPRKRAEHRRERHGGAYRRRRRPRDRHAPVRKGARPLRLEDQTPGRGGHRPRALPRPGTRRRHRPRSRAESGAGGIAAYLHGRYRQGAGRRIGQGRRGQIDRHGQSGAHAAQHGLPRGHPRRRHLRTVAAQNVRRGGLSARCRTHRRRGLHPAGRRDGYQTHVDRLLHQTLRRTDLARRHGDQRPAPDDPPDQMGRAGLPARRSSSRVR